MPKHVFGISPNPEAEAVNEQQPPGVQSSPRRQPMFIDDIFSAFQPTLKSDSETRGEVEALKERLITLNDQVVLLEIDGQAEAAMNLRIEVHRVRLRLRELRNERI